MHRVEVDKINQRLDMMQETVDNTFTMKPVVPETDLEELRALADDAHGHQDGIQAILNDVIAKLEEVVSIQEEIENGNRETYAGRRSDRGDEESIITAIQDAVNNAELGDKDLKSFASLHKRLIAIHDEFKAYERFMKGRESKYLNKIFKRMSDCYFSVSSGVYDLCSAARKAIYDHKIFKSSEIEKIRKAAEKNVIARIDKGLQWKEKDKDLALDTFRIENEKVYRKHYDKVKKQLDAIVKYLNPGAEKEGSGSDEE